MSNRPGQLPHREADAGKKCPLAGVDWRGQARTCLGHECALTGKVTLVNPQNRDEKFDEWGCVLVWTPLLVTKVGNEMVSLIATLDRMEGVYLKPPEGSQPAELRRLLGGIVRGLELLLGCFHQPAPRPADTAIVVRREEGE